MSFKTFHFQADSEKQMCFLSDKRNLSDRMKVSIVLIVFSAVVMTVKSAPPVFLESNGAKICTLNNVGMIPTGSLKYPVYQKVCRHVAPTLGDEDDSYRKANLRASDTNNDEEVEKVRRAIMTRRKKCVG